MVAAVAWEGQEISLIFFSPFFLPSFLFFFFFFFEFPGYLWVHIVRHDTNVEMWNDLPPWSLVYLFYYTRSLVLVLVSITI